MGFTLIFFDLFRYLVTPLMGTDLSHINSSKLSLSEDQIQIIIYQILRALKYIHSAGIVHRDLKPSNVLLNANCDVKIADFGMGRGTGRHLRLTMLEYVSTLWYHAPEGFLFGNNYGTKVDVWAVGCIMAELLLSRPLFPGTDKLSQLRLIMETICGKPSPELIKTITDTKIRSFIEELPDIERISLKALLPELKENDLNLMEGMLKFSAEDRISVERALEHPYFENLHDINDEPISDNIYTDDLDEKDLTESDYRALIIEEKRKLEASK